ncbi:MAG: family 10 glycosylhydrolase [Candidatus Marinimicrobia bacterium]|nr:family 10 glycosylhydrolase [Candidatus Neomarinimicrobiota bacterium]
MKKFLYRFSILVLLLIIYSCAAFLPFIKSEEKIPEIPKAENEFRAVWVATVANIDWPSKPGLTVEQQKTEALSILDTAKSLNLNAIIFQVRPHCDAFYVSDLEPWSYYLTGEQGKSPDPFYDPLNFWIDEAHKRGMELHAWFNPYRAHHPAGGQITDHSIIVKRPELAKKLSSGFVWLDPAMKETQQHSMNVILDVVKRYDIDGVHIDDYFYPYPSYNGDEDFPDDDSWKEYKKSKGKLSRDDWRRKAVNDFVRDLYINIKAEKRWVKFGISPFGIWRPNHPHSIKGFDQYEKLYADARLWLQKGWLDYFTPQLYWPINQIPQSYPVLLGWWDRQNIKDRNLWPGLFTSKVQDSTGIDENINQIMVTRGIIHHNPGHTHFSMKAFLRSDSLGLNSALKNSVYEKQALVPTTPWLDDKAPDAPRSIALNFDSLSVKIDWVNEEPKDIFLSVIYYQYGDHWKYQILTENSLNLPTSIPHYIEKDTTHLKLSKIAITNVDRCGNESLPLLSEVVIQ